MADRGRPRGFDRDAALRSAMRVFWAKGYDGASMSDLTEKMGINSPSLYAAFGGKEALFREAVDLYGRTEGGRTWASVAEAPTARAAVEGLLRASAETFTAPGKPRGCMIVLGAFAGDEAPAPIRAHLRKLREARLELLERRIAKAVADGELAKSVDSRTMATFYATVQQGMSIQARDGASREALERIAEAAMAAWGELTRSGRATKKQP